MANTSRKLFRTLLALLCVGALSTVVLHTDNAYSAAKKKFKKPHCNALGIVPLKQYLTNSEYACFETVRAATKAGYTALVFTQRKVSAKAFSCPVPAIAASRQYFGKKYSQCFPSVNLAKRAHFTHFVVLATPTATPTATPSATPTTGTQSNPTPTPTNGPTPTPGPPFTGSYVVPSFVIGPVQDGTNYQGTCSADLENTHITVNCTTNITIATSAHLHVVPDNAEFCEITNPGSSFQIDCNVTDAEAYGIAAGNGLLAVHGAGGELAGGLIK